MKEKICLVSPFPPPYGGIANWSNMINGFYGKSEKYELKIINTAPKVRSTEGRGLFSRVFVSGFDMLKKNKELKVVLKKNAVKCIHMTTSGQLAVIRDLLLMHTAKRYGVPVVYHLHFGRVPQISKANTREWQLLKKAMLKAKTVIAIDNTSLEALKKHCPEAKSEFVPNPIDTKALPKPQITEKAVAYLGWVIPAKGTKELISSWNTVGKAHPDWTLWVIGPAKDEYLNELKGLSDTENVMFFGEKAHGEAMELINKAEIFVLPSYTEGFPYVIMEAMALKKAIAATNVGAIPEMLSENSGIVFEPRSEEKLSAALKELIENPQKRIELSQNAFKRLNENYTIEKVTAMLENIWEADLRE